MRIRNLQSVFKVLDTDVTVEHDKKGEAFAEFIQVLDNRSLSLRIRDGEDDGHKALNILRKHSRPTGTPRVITLYTQLTSLVKSKQESMTNYIIRAETAVSCLRDAGEHFSDSLLIVMVLKGLPSDYHPFVTVITQRDKT
ncbi:CCHC-type Zinc finger, nucleic acid binding protein a [Plakobranchus ocellatus]|uniref:CCHC-type Zinc finger, nucleic acid binding protein a n=1 Tax=Plakobranchus ocellatus TaxID=259542 RepID=A0AAV4BX45_9GAST|nr:CCHC-type Zinc finger, nucleic acid binding protein a [Plakobranchus ocellatus]